MYVCMYVSMYVENNDNVVYWKESQGRSILISDMYVCKYVRMYMCVRMYVCIYVCMYVCMSVCLSVCLYVRIYVPSGKAWRRVHNRGGRSRTKQRNITPVHFGGRSRALGGWRSALRLDELFDFRQCVASGAYICTSWEGRTHYGVATISRLLKSIGLFCKRALQKKPIFSKETYNFKEPTNRSHPIVKSDFYVCIKT